MEACRERRGIPQLILNLDARLRSVVNITPRPLYFPGKDFRIHWRGSWASPNAGTDVLRAEKNLPLPGYEPRTVQPVASRYTDYPGSYAVDEVSLNK
jgi:hypothetical protein